MKLSTEAWSDIVGGEGALALRVSVLEALFDEAADIAFFVKDREGCYLAVNRSLAERYGFAKKADMIGKRSVELCPGPFGEVPSAQDAQVLKTGRPMVNHLEMQWFRPHTPCWCLTTKMPLLQDGRVVGLVGFSRDLQERVSLEEIPASLALALDAFEKDCGEPASPSSLAAASGMSRSRFARILKRVFGITPSQYISRTRINFASRLLRESQRSVAEIALDAGFSDHSAFTRAFRQATGVTPTEYRDRV